MMGQLTTPVLTVTAGKDGLAHLSKREKSKAVVLYLPLLLKGITAGDCS